MPRPTAARQDRAREFRDRLRGIRQASQIVWRAAKPMAVAQILICATTALNPIALSWLTKLLFDRLSGHASAGSPPLSLLIGGMIFISAETALLPIVARYVDSELQRAISLYARELLFGAVNRLQGLARLENPEFHDRLRVAQQAGANGPSMVFSAALTLAGGVVTVLGLLLTLLSMNALVAAAVGVSVIPTVWLQLLLSRRRARLVLGVSQAERRSMFYENLQVSLAAAKEVRLLGLGGFFRSQMRDESVAVNAAYRDTARRELFIHAVLAGMSTVISGAALTWATFQTTTGALSLGDVSAFLIAVGGVQGGIFTATVQIGTMHHSLLLIESFDAVVHADPDLPVPAAPGPVERLLGGIEMRDVWFRYSEDGPWILRGVNIYFRAGHVTGLVGQNGAGKSTIVKLLCRFYDPVEGSILWDGVDIRNFDVDDYRRRIGAVFQDFVAYEMTAHDNIALGDLRALTSRDAVESAAGRAGADEIVAGLPRGYDTLLTKTFVNDDGADGATGTLLSGGQWQRVALARAFMRTEPQLLVLDEPSSGFDAFAEDDLRGRLRRHRGGANVCLLISHRLNAVRDADWIVAIRDGVVVEDGRHDDLVERGGLYADLWSVQSAGYLRPVDAHVEETSR